MGKRAGSTFSGLLVALLSSFENNGRARSRRKVDEDTASRTLEREWYSADEHLPEIQEYVTRWSGNRDLRCLDLFGASGRVAETWTANGQASVNYDIKVGGREHDVTSRVGFWFLLEVSLRLARGSLLMEGAPCSKFIFLSSSVHQRREGKEEGDTLNAGVRLANLIVANMLVVIELLHERGVYFVLEQPSNSWMFKLPRVLRTFSRVGDSDIRRVTTWMTAFGHRMPKCTHLVGTMPTLVEMRRIHDIRKKPRTPNKNLWEQRESGVKGGADLPSSAEYTPEFCRCLFTAWLHCR